MSGGAQVSEACYSSAWIAVVIWSCGYKMVGYMVFRGLCCNVEVLVVWSLGWHR